MQLNSAIWGDESHQILQSNEFSNHVTVSDVVPDIYTYYNTIGMVSPIDNSIALWQLGDESWFNHQLFLRRDGNNVIQKNERTTVNAKSIWLCVPVTFNTNQNIHFNPTQYQCNLWDADNTSSYYNQPNANLRGIITGFNYNRLVLRHRLCCRLYNSETGVHSGSVRYFSAYDYFNGIDTSDNIPYREKYCVESLTCVVGASKYNTEISPYQVSINIPLNDPKTIITSARIYTNTLYNTPTPANNYYKSTYQYYAQANDVIGIQRINRSSIPQQSVFADNTSFYIDGFSDDKWVLDEFRDGSTDYIATRFTGTYDDIMKQLALFGFWFVDNDSYGNVITAVTGPDCTDEHVCLPEIVGGRTTGNYKRGRQAGADPQSLWGNQWRDNVGYTGDKPYKHDTNDRGDLTSVFHRASLANSLNYYVFTDLMLKQLILNINTGYQPQSADQFTIDFKGSNPADYIANIVFYPDGFVCPTAQQSFTDVKIGAVTFTFPTGVNAADVEAGYYKEYEPVTISPEYNSFMDYAPYTSISLYVPFCGSIDLDPAIWMNHTLTVRLFIDYLTGSCTAVLLRDNLAVDSISGTCGITIPITALATGSYQNAIKSAEIAIKQAEIQRKSAWLSAAGSAGAIIGGAATGNPVAVLGGIAGAVGAANAIESAELKSELTEYNIDHIAPAVENVSATSPANAIGMDYDIHLLIKRPIYINGYDENAYSQTIGHACCISGQLSQFSGLTIANAIKLENISTENDLAATAAELQMIRKCAENGIYL